MLADDARERRRQRARFRRAQLRQFIFTTTPDRLSGGRIAKRHLSQPVVVRRFSISSPAWPRHLDGLRIAHASDFHLGRLLPLPHALNVVKLIRAQRPDLVACTGDLVDLHLDDAPPLLDALASVDAPLGTALVLGNHDELHSADELCQLAAEAGLMLLRNRSMPLTYRGQTANVAGIDWAGDARSLSRYVDAAAEPRPDILLAHNPRAFSRAIRHAIPLTLSGHTHGGQIARKNNRNANLALGHKHRLGLFNEGTSHLYVTSGVGAWFPLRVNCPAEVAVITMKHGDSPEVAADGIVGTNDAKRTTASMHTTPGNGSTSSFARRRRIVARRRRKQRRTGRHGSE